MRIHIDNTKIPDNMETMVSSHCYKTDTEKRLLSSKGILKCHKGLLKKIKIVDRPIKKDQLDRFHLLCDSSEVITNGVAYQVPTCHVVQNVIKKYHRLRPRALVELVIEMGEDATQDFYFVTDEDPRSHSVREDILTFLSVLKFC